MKAKLSFVDRIKALLRVFHDDNNVALNDTVSHEIEFLPSSAPKSKRDARFASAMQTRNQVGALSMSSDSDRLWSANQKSDKGDEQAPSNPG